MNSASLASGASLFGAYGKRLLLTALPIAFVGLAACDDDDDDITPPPTTEEYSLTFSGDDTYFGAHAGDPVVVVVEDDTGLEVASEEGTISDVDGEPAFEFEFTDALDEDETYVIRYWIDSNFEVDGEPGTVGVCDEPASDHQWEIDSTDEAALASVSADVDIEDTHRPGETEDVCESFADFEDEATNGTA